MPVLLIVEDGQEYLDFFRLFLGEEHDYLHAQTGAEALDSLEQEQVDMVILDMRFERSREEDLLGDVDQVATDYFGGDVDRARRYIYDNQGTLVLAELRAAGHLHPALFVHDMPKRKLENLRRLYGRVHTVPTFDATRIRGEIGSALGEEE